MLSIRTDIDYRVNHINRNQHLSNKERQAFDKKVLQSIGHEELYDCIKESLLSMQHTRYCVK